MSYFSQTKLTPKTGVSVRAALIAGIVLLVRKPRRNEDPQRSSSRAASSR